MGTSKQAGIGIARKTGTSGIWAVIGSVPQEQSVFQDTGLSANTTYFYKVYAYTSYLPTDISAYSNEVSATTASFISPPAAPSVLTAIGDNGWTIDLTWTDNSTNEDGFIVERSPDDVTFAEIKRLGPDVLSYSDNKVLASVPYFHRVRAFNNVGESANASASITTNFLTPTDLSGGVAADTILTAANSPYFVSANYTIASGFTLTIEPGVHIRFASGVGIEVRGHLEAVGTASAPIVFTAADPSTATQGAWSGIHIANQLGGSATIQYAEIAFAVIGISIDCCDGGGPVEIYDTIFESNSTGATAGFSRDFFSLYYRCTFLDNIQGLKSIEKIIAYSKFINNSYGIKDADTTSVYFSVFEGHTNAAVNGESGALQFSTIMNNNIGIDDSFAGLTITKNLIYNNQIGVRRAVDGLFTNPPVNNNNLFDNTNQNIINNVSQNLDATNNWWGTTDTTAIEAGIFDFFDDATLGVVTYSPFLNAPIDIIP